MNEAQMHELICWISRIHTFVKEFGWMADSFVLDSYTENHWDKLPVSWQDFLLGLSPEMLADFMDFDKRWNQSTVAPLSLIAFRSTVKVLSLSRRFNGIAVDRFCGNRHVEFEWKEFRNLFCRHVKPKKRHEVERIAQVVSSLAEKTGATHVYDIGSGLGHLSRYLTYGYGLNLTCVDRNETFGDSATKFDKELESFFAKKSQSSNFPDPPSHLCLQLDLDKHEQHFQQQEFKFGFTGLHSCGNLSSVILHNFVNSPAAFVVSLGCCYMKLDQKGFPLSDYAQKLKLSLSYEALEVSCHALEQYCDRLRNGHVRKLMTHSYRAALETILIRKGMKRAGLRGIPHAENLSFSEYAHLATRHLENMHLSDSDLNSTEIAEYLRDWFKVVLFYSLRLMMASVIETVVLLDRALFIKESNHSLGVHVLPLFDPNLSPRNLAVICSRNCNT